MRVFDKVLVASIGCASNIAYAPQPKTNKQAVCLAYALYQESRGEKMQGKLWVAKVVVNRVLNPRWPDNICDVVYQRSQFSWTIYPHTTDQHHLDLAYNILYGKVVLPNTTSTHFHNHSVRPKWNDVVYEKTVGNHKFYRSKK